MKMKLKSVVMIGFVAALVMPTVTVNAGSISRLEEQRSIVNKMTLESDEMTKISRIRFCDETSSVLDDSSSLEIYRGNKVSVWSDNEYDLSSKLSTHLVYGGELNVNDGKGVTKGEVAEVIHNGYKYTYEVDQVIIDASEMLSSADITGLREGVTGYDLTIQWDTNKPREERVTAIAYLDLVRKDKLTSDELFNDDNKRMVKFDSK